MSLIEDLNVHLENSNRSIEIATEITLRQLENKTNDPSSRERALIWYPKATQINSISKAVYDQISTLKNEKSFNRQKSGNLFKMLMQYYQDILKIDSSIFYAFDNNDLNPFAKSIGSSDSALFYKSLFKSLSEAGINARLTGLQNNIKATENKTIAFCNMKVGSLDGDAMFDVHAAIVGQNSTYLKKGDDLIITAGIGAFSKSAQPKFLINGKTVEMGDEGFAQYKLKISAAAGKYTIPVIISFFSQTTGHEENFIRNIEYEVAKECNPLE